MQSPPKRTKRTAEVAERDEYKESGSQYEESEKGNDDNQDAAEDLLEEEPEDIEKLFDIKERGRHNHLTQQRLEDTWKKVAAAEKRFVPKSQMGLSDDDKYILHLGKMKTGWDRATQRFNKSRTAGQQLSKQEIIRRYKELSGKIAYTKTDQPEDDTPKAEKPMKTKQNPKQFDKSLISLWTMDQYEVVRLRRVEKLTYDEIRERMNTDKTQPHDTEHWRDMYNEADEIEGRWSRAALP
ncbi:hypothetical protein PRZ48_002266 [Zasmidium cellare]|uniref:Myb-like domain-containing protein n=1 Tax=Zasmidium cellare TaxID=395010 RepID=A0ABR0F3J4_ZASCE|nr:hypothetical protein PRZ48_002266 [Zasmidium cellare]